MKLMIVDDSAKIRRVIKELLSDQVGQFIECSDGSEAITKYNEEKPDLILMDIMMKKINGIAAAKKILSTHPHAKIFIITNYDDVGFRAAAGEIGILEFILKDDLSVLPNTVKRYFNQKL